ncbi:MAG TPA: putative lipoprotein [Myxococcota bacterium]|nr:putative lipoprotein [Myxococcota bacterium]
MRSSLSLSLCALAVAASLALAGCGSISGTLESPSDAIAGSSKSIGGSFNAISTSSGSGGKSASAAPNMQSFERDLRVFTAGFAVTPGGSREDFLRGVARIAEDHGVSDWEAEPTTPRAIGEGLRDAGLSAAQMDAFVDGIGRGRPEAQLALEGYRHPGS